MTSRALLVALALACAGCPKIDLENGVFACDEDLDCRFTAGETCVAGHCRKDPESDGGTASCTDDESCGDDHLCVEAESGEPRCFAACNLAIQCGGADCKLVFDRRRQTHLPCCSASGTGAPFASCALPSDCADGYSCANATKCLETCTPLDQKCAVSTEMCKSALSATGWGLCDVP